MPTITNPLNSSTSNYQYAPTYTNYSTLNPATTSGRRINANSGLRIQNAGGFDTYENYENRSDLRR
jgi:hypothetical protein